MLDLYPYPLEVARPERDIVAALTEVPLVARQTMCADPFDAPTHRRHVSSLRCLHEIELGGSASAQADADEVRVAVWNVERLRFVAAAASLLLPHRPDVTPLSEVDKGMVRSGNRRDAKLRVQMRVEIKRRHHRLAATSIFVTHDQVEAMTLADRLIIMNEGRIEQVGAPAEVYSRPCSRYAAGFIGSPAMNFFEARVHAPEVVAVADGRELCVPGNAGLPAPGKPVVLGIRPEDMQVVAASSETFKFEIEMMEELAPAVFYTAGLRTRTALSRRPLPLSWPTPSWPSCAFPRRRFTCLMTRVVQGSSPASRFSSPRSGRSKTRAAPPSNCPLACSNGSISRLCIRDFKSDLFNGPVINKLVQLDAKELGNDRPHGPLVRR